MLKYIATRILAMLVTILIIISITFVLMHVVPGGPFDGEVILAPDVRQALEKTYKLDDPLWKQYVDYMSGVVRLDLGPSFAYPGRDVSELIVLGFPVTATLAVMSMVMIVVIGIPLGVVAALKHNSLVDRLVMIMATLGVTIPVFVVATILLYVFGSQLGWFPIFGVSSIRIYMLPAVALSLGSISYITRLTRSSMLEVMEQDYILTARSKGLSSVMVVYRHALKNAVMPSVTVLGTRMVTLLTGSFVIEKIFALPGIGRYFVNSITNRDYPTIMGVTIFFSAILLLMMLIIDISYGLLDPRIRIDRKGASSRG